MKTTAVYPLRLPAGIRAEVERLAKQEGISFNQFIVLAVAQKVSALNTATYFAKRRSRADFAAFDRLMRRPSVVPQNGEDSM